MSDKLYLAWAVQSKTALLGLVRADDYIFRVYLYSLGINLKIGLK